MYKPVEYKGVNTAENFLYNLRMEEERIKKEIFHTTPMAMTKQDIQTYNNSTVSHACHGLLNSNSVRDHYHITAKFRVVEHIACNLKSRLETRRSSIPVVFHNLRGYDSHLLMQAISKIGGEIPVYQIIQKIISHSPSNN